MIQVQVCGLGAVSPAGWGVPAMRAALQNGHTLPVQSLPERGQESPRRVRVVPAPSSRASFMSHPRLRRASPLTHYLAGAVLEAVAGLPPGRIAGQRFGLIFCLDAGCVQYSGRFFEEVLRDPATASPMLFPETVFSAPASHVANLLETTPLVCTLVGDDASVLQGVALGTDWLQDNAVDYVIVAAAEEINWLLADALGQMERNSVLAAGAGALVLARRHDSEPGTVIEMITDPFTYGARLSRRTAAVRMREQLPPGSRADLLCDGQNENGRNNQAECEAWSDWPGARLSPRRVLGEGLVAAAAWQCVAVADALNRGLHAGGTVSLVGKHQQAIGARFVTTRTRN